MIARPKKHCVHTYRFWTPEEDELLAEAYMEGMSEEDIATMLDRSICSVRKRLYPWAGKTTGSGPYQKRTQHQALRSRTPWEAIDDETLLSAIDEKMPIIEIAFMLERSYSAVQSRLNRLRKEVR